MGFIVLKCPSCTADIQLDENREFGFCQYCGTKITQDIQKVNITVENEVKVQGISTVDNLLIRAKQFWEEGQEAKAFEYIDKVLDIDATNQSAHNLKKEIQIQNIVKETEALLKISELAQAQNCISKANCIDPNNPKILKLKETINARINNRKISCLIILLLPFALLMFFIFVIVFISIFM